MSPIELLFLCCVLLKGSEGLYVVELTLFGYNNPTGTCYDPGECVRNDGQHRCCDENRVSGCTGGRRCDSYFIYCLRPLGSEGEGCSDYEPRMSTHNQDDDDPIDVTQSMVLGLENPLILQGITESYDGVQVYVEIQDRDTRSPDELVDILLIDHDLPVGESTQRQTYNGTFGFVTMDLNITVFCAGNFQVPDCTQCVTGFTGADCLEVDDCVGVNCNGNGRCVDRADNFTCNCSAGFVGELCQTNIDECIGVNCSGNGRCVDGADSFSCDCDPGFTGVMCQTNIDDCMEAQNCSGNGQCVDEITSFTCECNPGYTGLMCENEVLTVEAGGSTGAIVGGVFGGVIAIVIIAAIVAVLVFLSLKWLSQKRDPSSQGRKQSRNGCHPLPGDNPVYEDGGYVSKETKEIQAPVHYIKTTSDVDGLESQGGHEVLEREMDNPIYGTDDDGQNDDVYSVPFDEQDNTQLAHDFENPIYGAETPGESTYSIPCDSSQPLYSNS